MSKVVDVGKVQRALNRAARNAQQGSSDVRAGKLLAGRNAANGKFATSRGRASSQPMRKKK